MDKQRIKEHILIASEAERLYAMEDKAFDVADRDDTIKPGDNAKGYRVMFDVFMQGEHYYYSPLVNRIQTSSFTDFLRETSAAIGAAEYNNEPAVHDLPHRLVGRGVHKANPNQLQHPANLEEDDIAGFYYFKSREVAEEYYKSILVGAKGTSNSAIPLKDYNHSYNTDAQVSLALFEVEGIEQRKPWDEGSMMDEMTINPEPIKSFSLQDANDLNTVLSTSDNTKAPEQFKPGIRFLGHST